MESILKTHSPTIADESSAVTNILQALVDFEPSRKSYDFALFCNRMIDKISDFFSKFMTLTDFIDACMHISICSFVALGLITYFGVKDSSFNKISLFLQLKTFVRLLALVNIVKTVLMMIISLILKYVDGIKVIDLPILGISNIWMFYLMIENLFFSFTLRSVGISLDQTMAEIDENPLERNFTPAFSILSSIILPTVSYFSPSNANTCLIILLATMWHDPSAILDLISMASKFVEKHQISTDF